MRLSDTEVEVIETELLDSPVGGRGGRNGLKQLFLEKGLQMDTDAVERPCDSEAQVVEGVETKLLNSSVGSREEGSRLKFLGPEGSRKNRLAEGRKE